MKLVMASSPHITSELNVQRTMLNVILALFPVIFFSFFFFGFPAFIVIISSVISAVLVESLVSIIKKEPLTVFDGSAALTGLLLALWLPPITPLWMILIGNIFAIGIVKQCFGGLGHNIFNPALAAKLFLSITYPTYMTSWYKANSWFQFLPVASSTPLSKGATLLTTHAQLFWGNTAGNIGTTSCFAIILGAIWLFKKHIIDWKTSASFLGTIFVFSILTWNDPFFQIMSGGVLFAAFFMLTDYVTTPLTKIGRILFGFFTGLLVISIRLWSIMPESIPFAVILMNGFVPLLDKLGVYLHLKIYEKLFTKHP